MPASRLIRGLLLAWAGLVGLAGAHAGTCNLTGGWVAFGAYKPGMVGNLDTLGVLALDCDGHVHAELSLSLGTGPGASYLGGRQMSQIGGSGHVAYNIYADAARTLVLGDGTGGSTTLQLSVKGDQVLPIFGRIPGLQRHVEAGLYADVLVATVSY